MGISGGGFECTFGTRMLVVSRSVPEYNRESDVGTALIFSSGAGTSEAIESVGHNKRAKT